MVKMTGWSTLALTCVIGQYVWSKFFDFAAIVKKKNVHHIEKLAKFPLENCVK